ncbi:hypothetical protein PP1_013205 [Pseudonocardia sp. P1]
MGGLTSAPGATPGCPDRLGPARLGSARLGSARLGSARLGSARLGGITGRHHRRGDAGCPSGRGGVPESRCVRKRFGRRGRSPRRPHRVPASRRPGVPASDVRVPASRHPDVRVPAFRRPVSGVRCRSPDAASAPSARRVGVGFRKIAAWGSDPAEGTVAATAAPVFASRHADVRIPVPRCPGVPVSRCPGVPVSRCPGVPVSRCPGRIIRPATPSVRTTRRPRARRRRGAARAGGGAS